MKIDQIIEIADKAYPDGLISQYWDDKKHRPIGDAQAKNVGDGLARFIVQELFETFDSMASKENQLNEAKRVMARAVCEIENCCVAFEHVIDSEVES